MFDQTKADEICARLSTGEPLASICRKEGMPAVRTVSEWRKANSHFDADFARAREEGWDAIAAECIEIAEDGSQDYSERTDPKTGRVYEAFDAEHVQRSKLRVETRLKLLAKWDPKRYGEKTQIEHTGTVNLAHELTEARNRAKG